MNFKSFAVEIIPSIPNYALGCSLWKCFQILVVFEPEKCTDYEVRSDVIFILTYHL